jgi:hypothetical protein
VVLVATKVAVVALGDYYKVLLLIYLPALHTQ